MEGSRLDQPSGEPTRARLRLKPDDHAFIHSGNLKARNAELFGDHMQFGIIGSPPHQGSDAFPAMKHWDGMSYAPGRRDSDGHRTIQSICDGEQVGVPTPSSISSSFTRLNADAASSIRFDFYIQGIR